MVITQINPTTMDHIPTEISDIHDRRNQLEGNVSLFQNLGQIEFLNFLFELGVYNESFDFRGITHQIKFQNVSQMTQISHIIFQ